MIQAGTATADLVSWSIALASARDEQILLDRLQQALQALGISDRAQLFWLSGDPVPLFANDFVVPLPDEAALARLHEGQVVTYVKRKVATSFLPLIHRELCGWLSVEGQVDVSVLAPLLQLVAASLAVFRRDVEAEAEVRDLALLNEIGRVLNRTLDLQSITTLVEEAIDRLLHSDHFFIALYDAERGGFRFARYVDGPDRRGPSDYRWTILQGLTGEIVRTGQPILTDSYTQECQRREVLSFAPDGGRLARAWLGVPLQAERILGVIVVYSYEEHVRFTLRQMRLLSALADHVAAAIERARLYERTAQMARQLGAVNEIGRAMTSTLDPEQVPSLIMGRIQEIMDVEEGSLLLRDEHTDELVFAYSLSPAGTRLLGTRIPPTVGIANEVIRGGESLLVNDATNHPSFYNHVDIQTGFVTRDLLCVPLLGRQGTQGVIEVINRRDGEPFTIEDQRLLELIADQAAVALENARLYARTDRTLARRVEELDRRNRQLYEIIRVANALMAMNSLDDLLPQIATAVLNTSGFQRVMICLVQRESGRRPVLRRAAVVGVSSELFQRLQATSADPAALEALLRPSYQRGHSTYFIQRRDEIYRQFWTESDQLSSEPLDPGNGCWHPYDLLVTVLRSSSGELMGLICVDQPENGLLPTSEQIQTLEIFASQASVALENADLYEQQRLNLQGLTALSALGLAIDSSLNTPEQILSFSIGGIAEATGALGAGVFLLQEGTLNPVLQVGQLPPCCPELALLVNQVFEMGKPRAYQAPERPPPQSLLETGSHALILYPLRGQHAVLGVIYIVYPEVLPSERDQELLSLFIGQAGVALHSQQLADAVRQGRDRLASILASTEEGIVMFDRAGRVAEANPAFARLCCLDVLDIQAASIEQFLQACQEVCGGDTAGWRDLAAGLEAVRSQAQEEFHSRLMLYGTRTRAFAWSVLPIRGSVGDHRAVILVLHDITKEVEAERLRQELTSMIVHDLRGPVSSILTGMEMFERGLAGSLSDIQRSVVDIASKSSRKLLSMVDTLLDIHKLEEGQLQLDVGELQVVPMIDTVCQQYSPLLENRRITLKRQLEADLPTVYADASHAERILQNLLDNAIKYSRRGATITIKAVTATPELMPPMHPAGRWIRISVRDEGPGIRPEEHERVFEKFGQATNSRVKGTGLGLTFCRLSVEAHGGRIWIDSNPGTGSTFHFTLPVDER